MTSDPIPEYLLAQRLRNRCIDVLELLAEGDEAVRQFGSAQYFNCFFDWFPDEGAYDPPSALSKVEVGVATAVLSLMRDACDTTPMLVTEDELIATGWPSRIQPFAQNALKVFMTRGRGVED
ncbi:hypothetical protein [Rhizobium sp. PP-CC-3G-465]|uniref:hypothetical protein n=1 Tax=Rhizobium sp. PP-CC-3G-465 TaxID=2135648 RepID=UPI0010490504|nr:hypothetical protein C8J33_1354 [Rhizobium sp. PP-CC-3G-465]